jgi:hypothetical protein
MILITPSPKPHGFMRFISPCPWFRRILSIQGNGKEGTRIEQGLTLLDKFHQQSEADMIRRKHQTMNQKTQEEAHGEPRTIGESESHYRASQTGPAADEIPTTKPLFIHGRGIQLDHVVPIHFVKSSMAPAHLQRKQSWWNTAYHAHASKMLLRRRWTYFLRRRTHRRRMDVQLRPCQKDTTPSHRSPSDRYAATPPTIWIRESREGGVIYRNGTITETTSFDISLESFRVQSLQEHEI